MKNKEMACLKRAFVSINNFEFRDSLLFYTSERSNIYLESRLE